MTDGTRQTRKRFVSTLAVGLTAALLLAGCSSSDSNGGGSDSGLPATSMLLAADNGSPTFEKNFNPYATANMRKMSTVIYEPLVVVNTLTGEGVPFLATGYEQPDAKTIVVDLREGVKWSDGKEFTAGDVTFTYDLLKKFPALDTTGVWQHIESIEAGDKQITIHLQVENVPAASIVMSVPIVPEHLWKDVTDPVTFANDTPVGTGPYVVGEFSPNEYTMLKNKDYWQADKVAAEELVLPALNDQLAVVNNGYDWAYAFMTDVENTWVAAGEGNTYWFPPGGTISLLPNLTKAPFNDVNFRRGMSAVLDRDKIAELAEEGYVEAAGQSGLLLPNQQAWVNSDLPNGGAVKQDLTAAADFFAQAGFTLKDGKLVDAAGTQLTVDLMTPNGWTDWLRGAQEVQRQLEAAGIKVNLQQPQPAALEQARNNGEFDLTMGAFGGTGSVYQDFNTLLNSEFATPIGTTTMANFQRFNDPAVDALLAELKVTIDVDKQKEIVDQLQQAVYDEVPVFGLFYGGLWGLFSEKNFTNWPSEADPYASPATWGANPLLVLTNLKSAS